ncbi:TPA: PAAR domain-containing protein [Photobacterium damselae]
MPKFVTQGTSTTTGGVVLEGHSTILIDGKPASSVNQKASCNSGRKSCKKMGDIVPFGDHDAVFLPNGLQAVLTGYRVLCNCPDNFILAPNNTVKVGSGTGSINLGGNVNMGNDIDLNLNTEGSVVIPNIEPIEEKVLQVVNDKLESNEHFILKNRKTSNDVSDFAYKLKSKASSVEGITKDVGKTKLITGEDQDLVELEYVFQTKIGIE